MGLFLVVYGCARFTVEWVRLPDANIGYLAGDWLTMGMLLTMPMIFVGAAHDDLRLPARPRRAAICKPPELEAVRVRSISISCAAYARPARARRTAPAPAP